ncbi:MAG: EamA family transporter, partial [Streptomycetaceae bacterium]|nr:EamA family transporter [Streptomycetaceae bacterium]
VGAVLVLPFGIVGAGTSIVEPGALGTGALVALMSSVVPYSCEMLAMKRLSAATFGLLASLEPAVAAVAGFVVLDQSLALVQMGGIALVVVASAGVTLTQAPEAREPGPAGVAADAYTDAGSVARDVHDHRDPGEAHRRAEDVPAVRPEPVQHHRPGE